MARSYLFGRFALLAGRARFLDKHGIPTREGVEALAEAQRLRDAGGLTRRGAISLFGAAAASSVLAAMGCAPDEALGRVAQPARGGNANGGGNGASSADIAVVGAGLAGLTTAYELQRRGVTATLYEASDRVGGRCWSLDGVFPGQVVERGGELIDTTHQTMRGYAREFGLTLESFQREEGEVFYHFDGSLHPESAVVDEYRAFVDAMRDDLRAVGSPTADAHTDADVALDLTNLADYLDSRQAGPLLRKVLDVVYNIEYGLEVREQSALAMLLFLHADRRNRFQPFGIFSDERFHVTEGNGRIPLELHARLARPAELGMRLARVAKTSGGRIELTFTSGRRTVVRTHDRAVITLPFSVLRGVELHASLGLPAWKTRAIRELRYGTNAKMMIGFTSRPWAALGSTGGSYSDLANHQATWETNPARSAVDRGVLTDYSSGNRGAALDPRRPQAEAQRFLTDLERIFPGAQAATRRDARGDLVVHLEHWPSSPNALGSYTANHPGYFTTIADNEAKPVDNLHFAGEHTSSFYEWQGFMEGGALSGIRAATEVYDAVR
ncbi:MAG: NAD(P)/FAD-dependent oxidoreductase [Polyangiales bacterium]